MLAMFPVDKNMKTKDWLEKRIMQLMAEGIENMIDSNH